MAKRDHLPGCASSPAADEHTSEEGRGVGSSSSLISIIASPRSVEVSVSVGEAGVCGSFSLLKVSPIIVREYGGGGGLDVCGVAATL